MIEKQLRQIRALYKTHSVFYTAQKESLTDKEFTDIIDLLKIEKEDGQHIISEDIVLTLKNGRAFITTNIAIYGDE